MKIKALIPLTVLCCASILNLTAQERLKDINPGSANSSPDNFIDVNGTLFFYATTATSGRELWKSDGTEGGTVMVKDINTGTISTTMNNLTNVNGILFFGAQDFVNGENGTELWRSDGTSSGTYKVKDIRPPSAGINFGSGPSHMLNFNGNLFFSANDGSNGTELWKSDGTASGTVLFKSFGAGFIDGSPKNLTKVNNSFFFTANTSTTGTELWKSDGTAAGTMMVKDINSSISGSGGANSSMNDTPLFTNVNGVLFFCASDGTSANLGLGGGELWKSDGTAAGTVLVKDINPGVTGAYLEQFTCSNGKLYFVADNGVNGKELWVSDGTSAGTFMLKDIRQGSVGSSPMTLVDLNGTLFFVAGIYNGFGFRVWKTDGTNAGTIMVKNIHGGNLFRYNNSILFSVTDTTNYNINVWQTDGSISGTYQLNWGVNKAYGLTNSYGQPTSAVSNNIMFFASSAWGGGTELCKFDQATVGIKKIENSESMVSIYPNPNNGEFFIETLQKTDITVYNSLGQIVLQNKLIEGKNKIDIREQTKGIYFVKLNRNGVTSCVKIINE